MTGAEKVAILIMILKDDNVIREIFNRLDSNEIYEISLAMSNLGHIDSEKVEKVLIEFSHDLNQSLEIVGNTKIAENFLKRILNENDYGKVLDKLKYAHTSSTWEMLNNLNEASIAQFLKNEYPQTSALILSKLSAYKSAKILKMLSQEYSVEVLRRMMYLENVKGETLESVEKVIEGELNDMSSPFNKDDNSKVLAEIFNNFTKEDERFFMNALKNKDPEIAEKISNYSSYLEHCDSTCTCIPNVGLSCNPDFECICPIESQWYWSEIAGYVIFIRI
jgi:flagellar motor switch protein FliG